MQELVKETVRGEMRSLFFSGDDGEVLWELNEKFRALHRQKDGLPIARAGFDKLFTSMADLHNRADPDRACAADDSQARRSTFSFMRGWRSSAGYARVAQTPAAGEPPELLGRYKELRLKKDRLVQAQSEVERFVHRGVPHDEGVYQKLQRQQDLKGLVDRRETCRTDYVTTLTYAQQDILRWAAGVADEKSLSILAKRCAQAKNELDQSIKNMEDVSGISKETLDEQRHTDTHHSSHDPLRSAADACASYDGVKSSWATFEDEHSKKRKESEAKTKELNTIMQESPAFKRKLLFDVNPRERRACFLWEHSKSSTSTGEPIGPKVLLEKVNNSIQAITAEMQFLSDSTKNCELRSVAMLQVAREEARHRAEHLGMLADAEAVLSFLKREHEDHRHLASLLVDPKKGKSPIRQVVDAFRDKAFARSQAAHDVKRADADLNYARDQGEGSVGGVHAASARVRAAEAAVNTKKKEAATAGQKLQEAMKDLFKMARDFPEVLLENQSMVYAVPSQLRSVWIGARSIAEFGSLELLKTQSCHKIRKVEDGRALFALKEYDLGGDDYLTPFRACMKEASLLARLRHPNIVELSVLFVDMTDKKEAKLYLQMPFYVKGPLDAWKKEYHPVQQTLDKVCAQALLGLAHCHYMRIVHADVKPSNILISEDENAKLADFDISVDERTRCTIPHQTRVPGTEHFMAPELKTIGASQVPLPLRQKSDMYAFGKTVEIVGTFMDLVKSMTEKDPRQRPSAEEVLAHNIVKSALATHPAATCECHVCMDYKETHLGVVCPLSHFICSDCVGQCVQYELALVFDSDTYLETHRQRNGMIACPKCKEMQIDDGVLDDKNFAQWLDQTTWDKYKEAKDAVLNHATQERLQAEYDHRMTEYQQLCERRELEQARQLLERQNEDATIEFLTRIHPNAKQCPQCKYGPVIKNGNECALLHMHHGQAMAGGDRGPGLYNNACPRCGFFSDNWNTWERWTPATRRQGGERGHTPAAVNRAHILS